MFVKYEGVQKIRYDPPPPPVGYIFCPPPPPQSFMAKNWTLLLLYNNFFGKTIIHKHLLTRISESEKLTAAA